ncbi:hypothetical protein M9H77_07922 [Catharanthus roseus]|uniref:Uncharacterized protein n=1 Tax=Catharanthus roseus TaxID=4058 RepID=A0ACC0BW92_CATRO|nr:hypothetical protein M9H77_07922 [Catharanthus roseus]
MIGVVQPDSSYNTHGYIARDYGVSSFESFEPFMGRQFADLRFEGDRGLGEEPDRVRSLYIRGEEDKRADDGGDGDGDDDDNDDGADVGDEEQPVPLAPAAPTSGSNGRPHHRKGKWLTGSHNKRPDKARDVSAPTKEESGGPVDLELIPSYDGHVAGPIWHGQDRGLLKCRSCYMALTTWSLTHAEVVSLATVIGLMHLHSCMFQHSNSALLSAFVEK